MNLIEILADKADDLADEKIQMPGEYHPDWSLERDKIFVKLIIRECINVHEADYGVDLIGDLLKKHFGVVE